MKNKKIDFMQKKIKWILPAIGIGFIGNAQITQINYPENRSIENIKDLYNEKIYYPANYKLNDIISYGHLKKNQLEIADYYNSIISVILEEEGSLKKFKTFKFNYPNSALLANSHMHLGDYYIINEDFADADKEYSQIKESSLSPSEKERFYIKKAYSLYMTEDYEKASSYCFWLKYI